MGAEDHYYQPCRELWVPRGWTKDTSSPFLSSASHPSCCNTTLSPFGQPSSAFPVSILDDHPDLKSDSLVSSP